MSTVKEIFSESRCIFILLGAAFAIEIFGIIPGSSTILPSTLVIVYFLGLSSIIRFTIVRRQLHKLVAVIIGVIMYFGYFVSMALGFFISTYPPSLLFMLCQIAAFKILTHDKEKTG
jgi:chromate transport protein ChrA